MVKEEGLVVKRRGGKCTAEVEIVRAIRSMNDVTL